MSLYVATIVVAAEDAASSNGPTVTIILAVVGVLGVIATALGPFLVELAKRKRGGTTPPGDTGGSTVSAPPAPSASPNNPLTPVIQPGIDALAMVDAAVRDYRQQRDDALRRVDELQERLDEANRTIARQLVYIARLEPGSPRAQPDPYGRPPMYSDYPPGWQQR